MEKMYLFFSPLEISWIKKIIIITLLPLFKKIKSLQLQADKAAFGQLLNPAVF